MFKCLSRVADGLAPVAAGARCSFVGICRTHRPASAAVSKFSLLESIGDYVGRVVEPMHLEVLKFSTQDRYRDVNGFPSWAASAQHQCEVVSGRLGFGDGLEQLGAVRTVPACSTFAP